MLFLSGHTFASTVTNEITANMIMETCKGEIASPECVAFMNGFSQGIVVGTFLSLGKAANGYFVGALTLKNMFVKHMEDHPEQGDSDVQMLLSRLLMDSGLMQLRKNLLIAKRIKQ